MAAISNFTASAKRKYYDGSSWHTEEIDFFQFPSANMYTNRDILYKTEEYTKYVSIGGMVNRTFDYYPGYVYKPKKYYKITDLFFSDSQLESLKESAKNLWQLQKDRNVYVTFNGTSESIITAEKDGKYVFALASMNAGVSSGVLPEKRGITLTMYCYYSKFKPEDVKIEYNERGSATTFVNDNGTWRKAKSGDFSPTNALLYFSRNESYTTWCDEVDNIFSDLRKVKFYFNAVTTYPYIRDLTIDNIKYGASNCPNYSSFIYSDLVLDISNCSFVKNSGFIPVNIVFWNSQSRDFQYYYEFTVDKTKSPSPSSNPEDDDPNDDDPGWQDPDDDDDDDGGDGDHDDSSDPIPEDPLPSISGSSNGLMTVWNPTASQLESLATKLWNPDAWSAIKQYFTNPMETILSLAIIPVAPKTTSGTIHLGGYNTEISAARVTNDYVKFDCGSIPINRYYGSYLDYAPFTKISCTLPYIGEVDIDPDQIMQKTLSISYHINCITGELVAFLLADNNVFATYAGNCVKQLPICQTDFSSIISGAVQICSTMISAGVGAASAGAEEGANLLTTDISAVNASNSAVKASSSLLGSVMSMKAHYKHSSQLGTGAGQLGPQCPFLTIIRPNLDLADNYKSFTGYPCNKNLALSSIHGFTQIEASNLSVPSASLDELSEIKELLLKGVII